ncbi:MAG TPA: tyrosine-type recombinase/integrase [Rhizomicrobium sp.]|jgi:integrase/recombinase XerD|nr:tyrosine-type recombinase/integrase [Rhizomicrobium sp.]
MLYDTTGHRKYLTSPERDAFITAASAADPETATFGLTLAYSGARISEVLATTPARLDYSVEGIVFRTLKRRRTDIFRVVPIPSPLLALIEEVHSVRSKQIDAELRDQRIWPWCRTTAWSRIKYLMQAAQIFGAQAMPKALRHGLGVQGAAEAGIPLNVMQKWMGHARIETTAIYANAVGKEERALASRLWRQNS